METGKKRVMLISGAGRGMGLAIAKEALKQGYQVAGTARTEEGVAKMCAVLSTNGSFLGLKMDLGNTEEIRKAAARTIAECGRIDVLVNNAGYGLMGYFEELSDEIIRRQFEANFFGTIALTREILPVMRKQNNGTIITTTSTSGIRATEGSSIYAASKFALEGWMEGLRLEVASFGIRCMILEPGAFRTDFFKAGKSAVYGDIRLEAYDGRREAMREKNDSWDGTQDGNPDKLAENLLRVIAGDDLPVRLLMSASAWPNIDKYYTDRYAEFRKWHDVTVDTKFENK